MGEPLLKTEFVTAGGVDLKEINFKRFESKQHKNLFLVGEVLNIDAVTGGFNFQKCLDRRVYLRKSIGRKIKRKVWHLQDRMNF